MKGNPRSDSIQENLWSSKGQVSAKTKRITAWASKVIGRENHYEVILLIWEEGGYYCKFREEHSKRMSDGKIL